MDGLITNELVMLGELVTKEDEVATAVDVLGRPVAMIKKNNNNVLI